MQVGYSHSQRWTSRWTGYNSYNVVLILHQHGCNLRNVRACDSQRYAHCTMRSGQVNMPRAWHLNLGPIPADQRPMHTEVVHHLGLPKEACAHKYKGPGSLATDLVPTAACLTIHTPMLRQARRILAAAIKNGFGSRQILRTHQASAAHILTIACPLSPHTHKILLPPKCLTHSSPNSPFTLMPPISLMADHPPSSSFTQTVLPDQSLSIPFTPVQRQLP